MIAYLIRRLLWMVPTFVVILIITFAVLRFQNLSIADAISQGQAGEDGAMRADDKKLGSQMETYLVLLRRTGRDLPAIVNVRGFYGKEQVLAWLKSAQRDKNVVNNVKAGQFELELWAAGPLLVEPLMAIVSDAQLHMYHAPAVMALSFCASRVVPVEDEERYGSAWAARMRARNADLRAQRIDYTNTREHGYVTSDPQAATKSAAVLALLRANPEDWERGVRRWTAVVAETGFVDVMTKLGSGQLYSETKRKGVFTLIADRWGVSFSYNTLSILIAWCVAVPLGIRSARRIGTLEDRITTNTLFLAWSLPSFFVGTLLLFYFCTDQQGLSALNTNGKAFMPNFGVLSKDSEWLSTLAWVADAMWHATLPMFVLCYSSFTSLSRYMRGSVLDNLQSDFARTARAKGVSEDGVIYRHVVPNSLITMITLGSGLLSALFGGSIVVEYIFSIPGLGTLLLDGAKQQDGPLIMGSTVITVGLLLIGILIADLLYAVADPRVRARYG